MAMTERDRQDARVRFSRKIYGQDRASANMDTLQLRAAVNAVDDWIDANAASFNAALPQPFKSRATAGQKSLLLAFVAMKKYGVS